MKIVIQPGHVNTTTGATGAPGERDFNLDVANQVSSELRKRGFEIKQSDANADKDSQITGQDWDLFLAIHYDADVYNDSGGFVDFPEPSTDFATKESQRIAKAIESEYFFTTGIKNMPKRSNANTRYYYIWKALSKNTPCVIIECGVGWRVPKDSDVLNSDKRTTLVVPGIVKGICKAFNIPYDITPPQPPVDPCAEVKKQLEVTKADLDNTKELLNQTLDKLGKILAWHKNFPQ